MIVQDRTSSISGSRSIHEMGVFWDTHDVTDYHDQTHEVALTFDLKARHHYVAIDPELLVRLRKLAEERGISLESLTNLWLQERALVSES